MSTLQDLKARILADGKIDEAEVAELRAALYADGKIDRDEVELLVDLRAKAQGTCPAFESLFVTALKEYTLADGSIDADEAAWLRRVLFADDTIDATERQLLTALRAEAKQVSPEFQKLYDECMK
jgi:hypothetical protein